MKITPTSIVHVVLGHSYLVYLFSLLVGFALAVMYPMSIQYAGIEGLGLILIVVGPILMFWAQNTSARTQKDRGDGVTVWKDFYRGPYTFTRSPTHLGLALMMLGLSFIVNSVWLIGLSIVAYLLTRYVFIRKEEAILVNKYGDSYRAYQTHVRF